MIINDLTDLGSYLGTMYVSYDGRTSWDSAVHYIDE